MKKLFLFILPLLAVTFNSCSKDDDGDGGKDNQFTIKGQTYEITEGIMEYVGNYYSENSINSDLSVCINLIIRTTTRICSYPNDLFWSYLRIVFL